MLFDNIFVWATIVAAFGAALGYTGFLSIIIILTVFLLLVVVIIIAVAIMSESPLIKSTGITTIVSLGTTVFLFPMWLFYVIFK
jgi:hypothetical protein